MTDIINAPVHYTQYAIEPITYIQANAMSFWRGSIIKYSSRAGAKTYDGLTNAQSEITDLKKAIWFCQLRIDSLEREDILK